MSKQEWSKTKTEMAQKGLETGLGTRQEQLRMRQRQSKMKRRKPKTRVKLERKTDEID